MEKKTKKILLLSGLLVALAGAVWYLLFYKPSAYSLARSLGLYTGDPLQDLALDNMIAVCLKSSGSISSSGNLEWELTEAARRYATPSTLPEDYWRINGKVWPVSGLLGTVDVTHDWLSGSPDVETGANTGEAEAFTFEIPGLLGGEGATIEMPALNGPAQAPTSGGESYIPQHDLTALWGIFNDLKSTLE